MSGPNNWRSQSPVSDPGAAAAAIDAVPSTLAGIHAAATQLVFHYRAGGDWASQGVDPARITEIDTRYAEAMFAHLLGMGEPSLTRERAAAERLVGCCRDFTLLFVSMARHKGIPARSRVGFASYFEPGWHMDHVVAEVWDEARGGWHLVDPQLPAGYVAPNDQGVIDPLNVPRDRFLTAPRAWLEVRAGVGDPERYLVGPDLDIPATRGWPFLRHNLIHDLAALHKTEMVLWDGWGLIEASEPVDPFHLNTLDHVARLISDPACPVENLRDWAEHDDLKVPPTVTSYSPAAAGAALQVDVSRAISAG